MVLLAMEEQREKKEGISLEEAYKEHIGEFGWGQVINTLLVSCGFCWVGGGSAGDA